MVATVGSIAVAFSADLRRYEASLRAGEKSTDRFERNANKATTGVGQAFLKMGGIAKAGLAGLAAGVVAGGITGLVSQFGAVANSIARIGDEAKRAGLSNKAFQELGYVAKANRIEVDALTDGMKELSLRADEYIATGKGSAAESFQRLGFTVDELKTKLKDPSALFTEIIGKLGQLDKAAQIRIADELFGGTGGEKFVQLIAQGEQGIKDTIQEAHNLNAVLTDDVIESAAELDRKFNAVATTVGSTLKSAIVSAAESLVDFINAFKGFQFERTAKLDERMASLGKDRLDVERQILELKDKQRNGESVGDGIFGTSVGESTYLEAMADYQRRLEAIAAEEQMIGKIIDERRTAKPPASTWVPPTPPPGGFGSSSGGRDKAAAKAEREAEAVRRLIDELQHEKDLIGATDLERDISNTLRQAGAAATDDQRAKIISLVTALHAEAEAQRQAADAAALYRDIAGGVLNDLRSALSDGKLEWEELADVALRALDRIIDKLLNDLLDALLQVGKAGSGIGGGGMFQSFIGGLLGIGFKEGGFTGHGAADEPAGVVHRGEVVFSKDDVRRHGGVAAVEAMRKSSARIGSLPGFAKGGAVGSYAAEISESRFAGISSAAHGLSERLASSSANLKERDVSADVRVFVDQDGNWQAAVERIAEGPAARAASGVARAVPSIALGAMEQNKSRRTRVISPRGGF